MPTQFTIHQPMYSGQADAQNHRYHLHIGKSGRRWLVADQDNAGDNVYVEGAKGSDGFGGATLGFPLVDGSTLKLTGPWKCNSQDLFVDTGVDVRDRHYTRGIIARHRINGLSWYAPDFYVSVLHLDETPVVGRFDRIPEACQSLANEIGGRLFYGVISKGGASAGSRDPKPASEEVARHAA